MHMQMKNHYDITHSGMHYASPVIMHRCMYNYMEYVNIFDFPKLKKFLQKCSFSMKRSIIYKNELGYVYTCAYVYSTITPDCLEQFQPTLVYVWGEIWEKKCLHP